MLKKSDKILFCSSENRVHLIYQSFWCRFHFSDAHRTRDNWVSSNTSEGQSARARGRDCMENTMDSYGFCFIMFMYSVHHFFGYKNSISDLWFNHFRRCRFWKCPPLILRHGTVVEFFLLFWLYTSAWGLSIRMCHCHRRLHFHIRALDVFHFPSVESVHFETWRK